MALRNKRAREIGSVGGDEGEEDAAGGGSEQPPAQEAKRRRLVGFGLGILSGLMDTVARATASVFGRGGGGR